MTREAAHRYREFILLFGSYERVTALASGVGRCFDEVLDH